MIWLSLLALAIVGLYLALMFALALFVGRMLREAREYDAAVPVRCTCRRHSAPSVLCEIHGGKA